MNDCMNTEVRDALPDLAHGRLGKLDVATMSAHVETCGDCRAELALIQQVRHSAPFAPRMNPESIAAAIPPYAGAATMARTAASRDGRSMWRLSLMAAAALVVFAIGGLSIRGGEDKVPDAAPHRDVASAPANALAPDVGAEDSTTLPASPAMTAAPAASSRAPVVGERLVASLSLVGGTQDLSEAQLESLLSDLEGMESLPSEEPQSVTHSVENFEGGT